MSKSKSPLKYLSFPTLAVLGLAVFSLVGLVSLATQENSVMYFPKASTGEEGNLVANPSFELDANNDKYPDSWEKDDQITKKDVVVTSQHYTGQSSLDLISGKSKYYTQKVYGYWPEGTVIQYSAFSKIAGTVDPNVQALFNVSLFKESGASIGLLSNSPVGNHDWTNNFNTYVVPPGEPYTWAYLWVGTNDTFGTRDYKKGDVYFDEIQFIAITPTPAQ